MGKTNILQKYITNIISFISSAKTKTVDRIQKAFLYQKGISLCVNFILLVVPIIAGSIIVINYYDVLDIFNKLASYEEKINSILILFIFIALSLISANLLYYIIDGSKSIFKYRGTRKRILIYYVISIVLIALLAFGIVAFVVLILSNVISFTVIIECHRYISLSIFSIFFIIDRLLIKSGKIEIKEIKEIKETSNNIKSIKQINLNIELSVDSTYLINIPTIVIIFLTICLAYLIPQIDYYNEVINKTDFLFDTSILVGNHANELFIHGIEAGMIMTSIVFSQIIFFVIKTKWKYRLFILKGNT